MVDLCLSCTMPIKDVAESLDGILQLSVPKRKVLGFLLKFESLFHLRTNMECEWAPASNVSSVQPHLH